MNEKNIHAYVYEQSPDKLQCVTARIQKMEAYFDAVWNAVSLSLCDAKESLQIQEMIHELAYYMDSGLWKEDYERDERGELPGDLKRGVLSEDGLYNLLYELEN